MAWIKWENTWNRKLLTNEHNILLYSPKTKLYIHSILIIQNYKILSLSLSFSLSPSLPLWKTLKVIILSRCYVYMLNPSWTTPACASVHCWTTPASQNTLRKWVVLLNVPGLLYFSSDFFQMLCVCRLCIRLLYIFKKTVLLWKRTSCHLLTGGFDCINLTITFWCWSGRDAQCNWKNLVAVLKELKNNILGICAWRQSLTRPDRGTKEVKKKMFSWELDR